MTERLNTPQNQSPYTLPPLEYRLHSREKDGLIPTPVDSLGLVDPTALFRAMAKTVVPGYKWESPFDSTHHLQWHRDWYPDDPENAVANPHLFRNNATSKWVTPHVLHSWIHYISEPPAVPDLEVMLNITKAERITISLAESIEDSKNISLKKPLLTEKEIYEKLMVRFDKFTAKIDTLEKMPPEFRIVDLSPYPKDNIYDMFKIGAVLGSHALTGTVEHAMEIMELDQAA